MFNLNTGMVSGFGIKVLDIEIRVIQFEESIRNTGFKCATVSWPIFYSNLLYKTDQDFLGV